MSGYFDALMRSTGITVGRAEPASRKIEPDAIGADLDRSAAAVDENTQPHAVTPHESIAALHTSNAAESSAQPWTVRNEERLAHEEPDTAPARMRDPAEATVHLPKNPSALPGESAKPDLADALIRAAMRWVAAGTTQGSLAGEVSPRDPVSAANPVNPDNPVNRLDAVDDSTQDVPRYQNSSHSILEQTTAIATKRLERNVEPAMTESLNAAQATPSLRNGQADASAAARLLPIRASLVPPAPNIAAPVRDEVVQVSIGTIHVRVDAPVAQTVARPAPTPAASAPRDAGARPERSALSRRALRRI